MLFGQIVFCTHARSIAAPRPPPHTRCMRLMLVLLPLASGLIVPQIMDVATSAAREAGRHLTSRVGSAAVLDTKLDSADLVTAVDKECQDMIESRIRENFPDHALLGEESVPPGVDAAMEALSKIDSEYVWIIDPIDGTTNFVSGIPLCAVSIGVSYQGERQYAVVYDPFRDELFSAVRGGGATLNGEPMRASSVSELREAVLCACSPHSERSVGPALRSIGELMPRARSIRILGSGVLNFAWVACGRLGAYWEPEPAPWDSSGHSVGRRRGAGKRPGGQQVHAAVGRCAGLREWNPRRPSSTRFVGATQRVESHRQRTRWRRRRRRRQRGQRQVWQLRGHQKSRECACRQAVGRTLR